MVKEEIKTNKTNETKQKQNKNKLSKIKGIIDSWVFDLEVLK